MPATLSHPRGERGYGAEHRRIRRQLTPWVESGAARCVRCHELIRPGEPWDLGHDDEDRSRHSGPEHRDCNRATAGRAAAITARERLRAFVDLPDEHPERDGVPISDERWRVPWLLDLLDVPDNAVWPRLMTLPHEAAVDSLGEEFTAWAEARMGRPLRWWQRLAATRLLEVDAEGRLVWEVALLTMARQLGKSWLLRELCLWRIHQSARFGEAQDVLHTGKDVQVCVEVQREARLWARTHPDLYRVTEGNGRIQIEYLPDRCRWLVRARGGVYGYTASLAAVDECWKIDPDVVDEGVTPTMVEREQPQLLLISTAHRLATTLMLGRRKVALDHLEDSDGDLLVEWSAPRAVVLDDRNGWRLASPHWTPRRERLVARQLDGARLGDLHDPDEPDPVESFRAQWLNQWPDRITPPNALDSLLPAGLWAELAADELGGEAPIFVAVEDDYGLGAAVAAAAALPDGRLEVDGWLCPDWDAAIRDVRRLGERRRIRHLQVGASLLARVPRDMTPPPKPAGQSETRVGLALLRDLAAAGQIAHDVTPALDTAVTGARVRESTTGLQLVAAGQSHLVKALVWALNAAHDPRPMPAVF